MDIHIIKLIVWTAAILGIYVEANEDLDNTRYQRDIIPGGLFDNNNYAAKMNYDIGSNFEGNNKPSYGIPTQLDNIYSTNEQTNTPMSNFIEFKNTEDYARYMATLYRKENSKDNRFPVENNDQFSPAYNRYQGVRNFQNTATKSAIGGGTDNTPKVTTAVGIPQNYQAFNRYIPAHLSRRIIVPVPTPIPAKLPGAQLQESPYLASYQVHPSVSYTGKLPIAAPIPVDVAAPNQYPKEVPPPAAVGFQEPIYINVPESYYLAEGNKDIVEYGSHSKEILPKNKEPLVKEEVIRYRQPVNYYNAFPGETNPKINSFGGAQKPIQETFGNIPSYYSYPAPKFPERTYVYGNGPQYLHNVDIQSGRNHNSMNKNVGSRYPTSKHYRHLRQGKSLNRNKKFYGYVPPCIFHRKNYYRY